MRKLVAKACIAISAIGPVYAASFPPIVLNNGKYQQAQSGDTVKIPNIASGTQCVHADASGNLTGTGADCGSGSGTVTTTGSPASGNLTKFSGASSITNGDLSGDLTTAGTLATTLATVNSNVGTFGDSTHCASLTVNGKGLITAASQSTTCPGGGGGGNLSINAQTGTTYTLNATDLGKIVTFNSSSAITLTVPQAGTGAFTAGYYAWICAIGTGLLDMQATTSSINKQTSHFHVYPMGGCVKLISDGTNYFTTAAQGIVIADGQGGEPALQTQWTDGTSAGGNVRGGQAVDLQFERNANTQVASGQYSFAAGRRNTVNSSESAAVGANNSATGGDNFVAGSGNTASGSYADTIGVSNTNSSFEGFAIGSNNTSSGNYAVCLGWTNTCNGHNGTAIGSYATTDGDLGKFAFNSYPFYSNSQNEGAFTVCTLGNATNGSAAVRLTADGGGAGNANVCALPDDYMLIFTAECKFSDNTAQSSKIVTYTFGESLAYRPHAGNFTLSSGNPAASAGPSGTLGMTLQAAPTIAADTTHQGFDLEYTPPTGNTDLIIAACSIRGTESLN